MSITKQLPVKDLSIDLYNFRTVPQIDELQAIKAMISISADFFWGLTESLLDDGYLPTENIIVLQDATGRNCVKEGNRRIAALKILLGIINGNQLDLPRQIERRINNLSDSYIQENSTVPCTVFSTSEEEIVDKIVTRTHGKGSKAGRDVWEAVARARHNRDKNGAAEMALDLLEKYLIHGTNFSQDQKARWAGRYNLTVLDEAIKRISTRFGVSSSTGLVRQYPNVQHRKALDDIIHSIGMEHIGFNAIRASTDFALRYGVPPLGSDAEQSDAGNHSEGGGAGGNAGTSSSGSSGKTTKGGGRGGFSASDKTDASTGSASGGAGETKAELAGETTQSAATTDERTVKRQLRGLKIYGLNRAKLETIRKEALKLKLKDNPIAFCFLLRSMFEISAKVYCQDRGGQLGAPTAVNANGSDRALADVLRDIVEHLTQNKADKQMVRLLHGPLTEILRPGGILSLTSMNQLVHNTSFTIISSDIPGLFTNIFPLLEQMNK